MDQATAEELRTLKRAEERVRRVERKAAEQIAQARSDLAQVMRDIGASAVARATGVSRQAVSVYIVRNLGVSPDGVRKRPARKPTR